MQLCSLEHWSQGPMLIIWRTRVCPDEGTAGATVLLSPRAGSVHQVVVLFILF